MRITLALAGIAVAFASAPLRAQKAAAPLNDATIVAIFDAANTFDIETSNLALKKAQSQDTKDLASQFVTAHTSVRHQGRDLAKKLHVTPTPPKPFALAEAHAKAMLQLHAASGAAFDKAYVAHEVAYHQAVIDAVTGTLLPAIQNAELKAFVQSVAPAFQAHLATAKELQVKLGQ